jgi:hypothetical protein
MKALSSAGFLVGGLAIGILLGRGPISSNTEARKVPDAASTAARPVKSDRSATRSLHPGVSTIRQADPGELAALTEQATTMTDPVEIRRLLTECLLHMTTENWADVVATFGKISRSSGRDPADEWKLALFRAGQVAGGEAMDSYLAGDLKKQGSKVCHTLYGWGSKDPRAALDWLRKAEAEGHKTANEHYTAIISGAALNDPQAALKLLAELPAAQRKDCAGNLVWNVVQNGGTGALDPVLQYASALDTSDPNDAKLANDLFQEVTQKLLWQADQSLNVQQACDVVAKMVQYGRDPNELTHAVIQKYRYYLMPDKLNILETVSASPQGSELKLAPLTSQVMSTMNGEQDVTAVRGWMQEHPDSPLIPHLKTRFGVE